jgi:RimJ/RimL family protein N-acetyltransferase
MGRAVSRCEKQGGRNSTFTILQGIDGVQQNSPFSRIIALMTHEVWLREVQSSDLPIFFEQQRDPEAVRMAEFPARDYDDFMAHWSANMAEDSTILRTVLFRGDVAGNIVSWEESGQRNVGYWLGKDYWGKGIASAALEQFLQDIDARPLYAHVAKTNAASIRVLQKCGFRVFGEAPFTDPDGEPGEEFIMILE